MRFLTNIIVAIGFFKDIYENINSEFKNKKNLSKLLKLTIITFKDIESCQKHLQVANIRPYTLKLA